MDFEEAGTLVLPAAHGKAICLRAGWRVRVVNPHGTQALDFWAFNAADPSEFLSMDNVRSFNSVAYVEKETALVTTQRRPIVCMTEDTSAGQHDTLLCACNPAIYRELGVKGYHRSCSDNLHEALGEIGWKVPFTPAPLNMFMSVDVRPDGSLDRILPRSKPGAHVELRAEFDAVLVFSNCPQDVTTINGPDRTPRDCVLEILPPADAP
ncbi:urea carboxylase-associated family protein [Ancylobacter mangrovi]|uniref:urea carboxylase-associated family protein n=1 Tax=Ancylobacter mangrovi TaxID=2972472 RepID=UPI00216190FA|nr:urea carboxylase-associated family protein [Ancylobacter mangrovi]MCS0502782.1 urea carboxylase-associated family protein [Ancylobacter mangrovi]